jgi:hypothetical protein
MATNVQESRLGLFRTADEVVDVVSSLRSAGFKGTDVKVLTDSPYPEGAFGEETERHRLYVFPFIGAACGFSVGLLLTIGTQIAYPIITGGKPIQSIPPMIHIIYEGTMLGAILFTIMGILFESRLPFFGGTPYDRRISEGYLGVLVTKTDGRTDVAERVFREGGAVDVISRANQHG